MLYMLKHNVKILALLKQYVVSMVLKRSRSITSKVLINQPGIALQSNFPLRYTDMMLLKSPEVHRTLCVKLE